MPAQSAYRTQSGDAWTILILVSFVVKCIRQVYAAPDFGKTKACIWFQSEVCITTPLTDRSLQRLTSTGTNGIARSKQTDQIRMDRRRRHKLWVLGRAVEPRSPHAKTEQRAVHSSCRPERVGSPGVLLTIVCTDASSGSDVGLTCRVSRSYLRHGFGRILACRNESSNINKDHLLRSGRDAGHSKTTKACCSRLQSQMALLLVYHLRYMVRSCICSVTDTS